MRNLLLTLRHFGDSGTEGGVTPTANGDRYSPFHLRREARRERRGKAKILRVPPLSPIPLCSLEQLSTPHTLTQLLQPALPPALSCVHESVRVCVPEHIHTGRARQTSPKTQQEISPNYAADNHRRMDLPGTG